MATPTENNNVRAGLLRDVFPVISADLDSPHRTKSLTLQPEEAGIEKRSINMPMFILPVTFALSLSVLASQEEKPVAVQFTSLGRTVHGLLWGQGAYGVVLSHGAISDAASWTSLANALARNGMAVLAREEVEPDDLLAANSFRREEYGTKAIGLIGASAGGGTALAAMARSPQLWDQLILLSSAGNVGGLGTAPKLFVASENEGMAETARRMARESPGAQNDVLIVRGSAHAQAIFRTPEGPRLTKTILDRLESRAKRVR
jgi:pimeloyl-ACP methyl ester carboxylesterase